MNSWKHPSGPADASVNLDFYVESARTAEVRVSPSPSSPTVSHQREAIPHFLNRFRAADDPLGPGDADGEDWSRGNRLHFLFRSLHSSPPICVAGPHFQGPSGLECRDDASRGRRLNYSRPHPDHALRYEIADEYLEVDKGSGTAGTTTPSFATARPVSSSSAKSSTRSTTRGGSSRWRARSTSAALRRANP